jgi:hypothetical protein
MTSPDIREKTIIPHPKAIPLHCYLNTIALNPDEEVWKPQLCWQLKKTMFGNYATLHSVLIHKENNYVWDLTPGRQTSYAIVLENRSTSVEVCNELTDRHERGQVPIVNDVTDSILLETDGIDFFKTFAK